MRWRILVLALGKAERSTIWLRLSISVVAGLF